MVTPASLGQLARLVQGKLGSRVRPLLSAPGRQVGTSVEILLQQSPDRVAALVINLSGNLVFVLPDPSVSTTHGIRLGANGGKMVLIWDEDFDMTGYAWHAIASGAGSDVLVLEYVADEGSVLLP